MNIMSDVEWEMEQINTALDYYNKAILEASSYEDHMRYAETVKRLQDQLSNLKGETQTSE